MQTSHNAIGQTNLLDREKTARYVSVFLFASWCYSAFSGTLVHQLEKPVWPWLYADPSYWTLFFTGIPNRITQNLSLAYTFDSAILFSIMALFLVPDRVWMARILWCLFGIYVITLNAYGMHHASNKAGLWWMITPFCFRDLKRVTWVWQALRYYALFIFVAAAGWKISRGAWLHPNQGILIVQKNLIQYVFEFPNQPLAKLYQWVFAHPAVANALYLIGVLLEGSFMVGYFTKKWDRVLIGFAWILCIGFWWMADAFIFELLVLFLTLLPAHRVMLPTKLDASIPVDTSHKILSQSSDNNNAP
jgi:hypothetical protein